LTFLLHGHDRAFQIAVTLMDAVAVGYRLPWGATGTGLSKKVMGIVMKKLVLLATALAIVSGSAFAADLKVKAVKAPPPPAFDPWDIAFGSAITNDYVFRGITQSNHKPSVSAYFEPRYNVTKDFQLYVGLGGASISFANRAAAEIDAYGGARLTVGQFAFDVGAWGYLYPGGTCQFGAPGIDFSGKFQGADCALNGLVNGNVLKEDVSFFEVYGKVNYTFNDNFSMGGNIVLKLAGEWGSQGPSQFRAVAVCCPAIDLSFSSDTLHKFSNRLYERYFLWALHRRMVQKARLFPVHFDVGRLRGIQSLREFDDKVTAYYCGFTGVDDYYDRASAAHVIDKISVPALILHGHDDHMVREPGGIHSFPVPFIENQYTEYVST